MAKYRVPSWWHELRRTEVEVEAKSAAEASEKAEQMIESGELKLGSMLGEIVELGDWGIDEDSITRVKPGKPRKGSFVDIHPPEFKAYGLLSEIYERSKGIE